MVVGSAGQTHAVVIGRCAVTAAELSKLVESVRRVGDLSDVRRRLCGDFHLVASVAGEIRADGSISSLRQVFYAAVDGMTVAASESGLLAPLAGAELDEEAVALQLVPAPHPYPLGERCPWQGVKVLSPDSYLVMDRLGRHSVTSWWSAPEPEVPLSVGASATRQEMVNAAETRSITGASASMDLSGGMDSTSLTFLAAANASRLFTVRRIEADPGSDDDVWARQATALLPNFQHHVLRHNDAPSVYSDIGSIDEQWDAPYRWIRSRGRHKHLAGLVAGRGSRLHLSGHGGDELFGTFPSYLHTLVRSDPKSAMRHLRGHQALRRWSWSALVKSLRDRQSLAEWLRASADQVDYPLPPPTMPSFGWGWPIRLPPWATSSAVEAVTDLLRAIAHSDPAPLARSPAQHEAVQYIRGCASAVRQVAALMSHSGVELSTPYLDDRVIDAALAVRLHERMTPESYKPLLAAAMRGIVPDGILGRTTKGDFTADVYAGLRRSRTSLLALFEDSVLVERGLVDADRVRAAILGVHPNFETLIPLEATVACESWLRTVGSETPATKGRAEVAP